MEKLIRGCVLLLLLGCMAGTKAQGVHQGMVRAQGTLAAGVLNSSAEIRFYVYGELECMLDDNIGINGAAYGQVGSSKDEFDASVAPEGGDYFTHSIFVGPVYHFKPNSPLDLYAAIQPGLHMTKSPGVSFATGNDYPEAYEFFPSASVNVGIAYYGSFFHVFGQLRALTGQNLKPGTVYGIGELRPTFGLGFNIF